METKNMTLAQYLYQTRDRYCPINNRSYIIHSQIENGVCARCRKEHNGCRLLREVKS